VRALFGRPWPTVAEAARIGVCPACHMAYNTPSCAAARQHWLRSGGCLERVCAAGPVAFTTSFTWACCYFRRKTCVTCRSKCGSSM
jgi:hypothetical protein